MRNQVLLPGLNRRLVMEQDGGRVRELLLAVGLSGLMLMPLLLYVWQNIEWIRTGYRVEKLEEQREQLTELNHKLRLEKASLETLTRVEHEASSGLGLAPPPPGATVIVDANRLARLGPEGSSRDRGDGSQR